jgi:hypothetical protein
MFRVRVIPAAVALTVGVSLSACSGTSSNFDPTDWITGEFFSNKTPLPGERKAVFPGGVPGVPEGVPPELVRGSQERQAVMNPAPVTAPEPAPAAKPAQPRPQTAARPAPKPRTASAAPQPAPVRTAPPAEQQQQQQASQPSSGIAWPDPNAARAPQQQQPRSTVPAPNWPEPNVQANWPPPNPNTFSR